MGRPLHGDATATWKNIRRTGMRLLFKHGFETMNLRQLAAASSLKPGSLYNYFSSKSQFLSMILCDIMETILSDLQDSVEPVEEPCARLAKFVEFHILWHTARREETFIGFMEMRNLSPDAKKKYLALRRRYEDFLTSLLISGAKQGKFVVGDPRITTFAILNMLTGACTWYKKGGRLSQVELAEIYKDLVFGMLHVDMQNAPRRSLKRRTRRNLAAR